MTTYAGSRAFDAEIFLDLQTGELKMDYTLNKYGRMLDSSFCEPPPDPNLRTEKNEFNDLPFLTRLHEVFKAIYWGTGLVLYSMVTMPLVTVLFHKGVIKNKQYQIEHQKILRQFISRGIGTKVTIIEPGFMRTPRIVKGLWHNMWVSYILEGEFKDFAKSVALKRHMEKRLQFGKFEKIRQNGWDLEIEFTEIPKTGRCIIESI